MTQGPLCPHSLVKCGFSFDLCRMIHPLPPWNVLWWNPVVFCRPVLSALGKWPSLLLSCSAVGGLRGSGLAHVHCSTICHSLKGVRYDLTRALWDLSEVTYLRQLALTKYWIHFTAALQEDCERLISWWHVDSNTIYLRFSSPWQWDRKILLKLIKSLN